jgi:hypothetical protein
MFLLEVTIQLLDRLDTNGVPYHVPFVYYDASLAVDLDGFVHMYKVVALSVDKTFGTDKFSIISLQFKPQ